MKPQSHASSLGSEEELSERTTSSKVRSETVDSILSAVAKKKVVCAIIALYIQKTQAQLGSGLISPLGRMRIGLHKRHWSLREMQWDCRRQSGSHSPVPKHVTFPINHK